MPLQETAMEEAHACERHVRTLANWRDGRRVARGADGMSGFERQLRGDRKAATERQVASVAFEGRLPGGRTRTRHGRPRTAGAAGRQLDGKPA